MYFTHILINKGKILINFRQKKEFMPKSFFTSKGIGRENLCNYHFLASRVSATWILLPDCTRFNATTNQLLGFDVQYKFCYIETCSKLL